MNYWVQNEFDIGNDPTPGIRPYWLTDYALSDGVTGPRSIVAKLSGPTGTASGDPDRSQRCTHRESCRRHRRWFPMDGIRGRQFAQRTR